MSYDSRKRADRPTDDGGRKAKKLIRTREERKQQKYQPAYTPVQDDDFLDDDQSQEQA